jgi:hypothetical protein
MLDFLMLMCVPLIIALGALFFFKGKVTIYEFLGQLGVVAVCVGICLAVAYNSSTTDTEIWNGQVTSRTRDVVSCSHSYDCNCYTDSKGNRHCSTCYEHAFDVDWTVHATTGEAIDIDREDRQGLIEPKRWDAVYPGQPFSSQHTFTNYIRANPDSVLLGTKGDVVKFAAMLPPYPDTVYDYYSHDAVVNMGVPNIDMNTWNWLLANNVNKLLGPSKQVNVILIFVPTDDASYMLALKDKWMGGKKNDVTVVIGSKDGHKVEFADVMSWSTNSDLKIVLKDSIEEIGTLDQRDAIVKTIATTVQNKFVRMHMKDMKYLMRSFQPSGTSLWVSFIISVLLSIGLAIWSVKNDITDDSSSYNSRY